MNQDEINILNAAKASNGGGIQDIKYAKTLVDRMVRSGYLTIKKGSKKTLMGGHLLVITRQGREQLERADSRTVYELIADEGRKVQRESPIHLCNAPPWE